MNLEWKEPPVPLRERLPWDEIADELRSHPDQWAVVKKDVARSNGYALAQKLRVAGVFEAVYRPHDGAYSPRGDVYARYVGNGATR